MKKEIKDLDKLSRQLIQQSISAPPSDDFDEKLMEKIAFLPLETAGRPARDTIRKGWIFWSVAVLCMLFTAVILSWLSQSEIQNINITFRTLFEYTMYGGLALFIPLMLYYFDILIDLHMKAKNSDLQFD